MLHFLVFLFLSILVANNLLLCGAEGEIASATYSSGSCES